MTKPSPTPGGEEKPLHDDMDAQRWAREFMESNPSAFRVDIDEATMIGWFANSIMCGYDEAMRRAAVHLEAALDLLEMCNSCDLIYSVSHATGVYKDGKEDERRVADLVRAFLKEHGRE